MSNPFADIAPQGNENIEQESDRLGGSFLWPTAAYEVSILAAYMTVSGSGAKAMNFEVQDANGKKLKFTEYVTGRNGKSYYERDGKKTALKGFNIVNAISLFTTKLEIFSPDQKFETKIVKLRNKDTKTDVPTEVPMAVGMLGQKIILGVQLAEVHKTRKVSVNGKDEYQPVHKPGEPTVPDTRQENEIDKIFFIDNKCTVAELRDAKLKQKSPEALFYPDWVKDKTGKVISKLKKDAKLIAPAGEGAGPAGTPTDAAGEEVDSLFG